MFRVQTNPSRSGSRSKRVFRPRAEGLERRRLLNAGGMDPTFDGDGFVTAVLPYKGSAKPSSSATAVGIQADGKIVAAGVTPGWEFGLLRVNPDGSLDPTFGAGGKVTTNFGTKNQQAMDMAVLSDGKILAAGWAQGRDFDFALARYTSTGGLDASFGVGGKVTTNIGTSGSKEDSGYALAVYPVEGSYQILVAGQTRSGTYADSALVRYNASGSVDTGFGQNGKVVWSVGAQDDVLRDVTVQPDGTIVVTGWTSDASGRAAILVARFTASGSFDPSFGTDGKVVTYIGAAGNAYVRGLAIQGDGRIVVVGAYINGSKSDIAVVRYNTDGSLDEGFGTAGKVVIDRGANEAANAVALQGDGKIVVAGYSNNPMSNHTLTARLNSDGSPDDGSTADTTPGDSFGESGGGGVVVQSFSGADYFNDVALQLDGKIVAVGSASLPGTTSGGAFLVARFLGDSGTPGAPASLSAQGTSSTTASREASLLTPLDPVNDHDLTQLATEWLRSTPKRSRPASRPSYRPMIP
jgi:uncharacterized delta-60 repeat protein